MGKNNWGGTLFFQWFYRRQYFWYGETEEIDMFISEWIFNYLMDLYTVYNNA